MNVEQAVYEIRKNIRKISDIQGFYDTTKLAHMTKFNTKNSIKNTKIVLYFLGKLPLETNLAEFLYAKIKSEKYM